MERASTALCVLFLLGVMVVAVACDSSAPTVPEEDAGEPLARAESEAPAPQPAGNTAPSIRRIEFEPEAPVPGAALRAVVEAADAEEDGLFFRYEWRIDGELMQKTGPKVVLEHASKGQVVEVRVVASDGKDESAPFSEQVELENRAPEIASVTIEPGLEVFAGTQIVVRPDARDLDGDGVTFRYEWEVNGHEQRESGPALETRRLKRGDEVRVRIVASDGEADSEPQEAPGITIVNAPPRIVSRPPETLGGGVFVYHVVAEDPDGDKGLQFYLEDEPPGMTIESLTGVIRWTPSAENAGQHSVAVIADDLQGGRSRQVFEVRVSPPDGPPAAPAP